MATKTKAKTQSVDEPKIELKQEFDNKKIVPKEIDINQYVTVRNGFHGTLVYKSSRTGEKFVWDEFGDSQEIELRELKNAKSSHKKMFENNWFIFDDDWVIDFLGVKQYYRNCIGIDNFDDFFKKSASEIKNTISSMTDAQKRSVSYRAKQLISGGKIDSRKVISTLEEALGLELIER